MILPGYLSHPKFFRHFLGWDVNLSANPSTLADNYIVEY